MPEYNRWFKDVLAGKILSYHTPRRRLLLEILGVPLFLYHSHEKKIVGEAAINSVTKENGLFHYWFTEFLLYPNFVDLRKIETDQSLQRLMRGRTSGRYLNERTIKEIRNLSGLSTDTKQKLADELQIVTRIIAEAPKPPYTSHRRSGLLVARSKLEEMALKLQTDETVLNKAQEIFSSAIKNGVLRGRSALGFACASLFAAYRGSKIPITSTEISKICGLRPKELFRDYRTLRRLLGLAVPIVGSEPFVSKYSQQLPISQETVKLAMSIAAGAQKSLSLQRSPATVAATAIHIACMKHNENITQEQIAEIFGITSASIRKCSKLLRSPM
jgi:transcription initiation factor TFIIB